LDEFKIAIEQQYDTDIVDGTKTNPDASASEERDFAGIGRDAVAEEDVVRFGMAINGDDELRVRCGMRSMVTENAGTVADLGDFQIVAVDENGRSRVENQPEICDQGLRAAIQLRAGAGLLPRRGFISKHRVVRVASYPV
jgi:hypothetical protein